LSNLVPEIEFDGHIGESADFELIKQHRFNHNVIAQKIARDKLYPQNEQLGACLLLFMIVQWLIQQCCTNSLRISDICNVS
jgi:hypothetical protein